jgi:ubiquinone/menaquinone biosynthesis C-methylase UbiE
MSLAAMVLADRIEPFARYYDRLMSFLTGGRDAVVRKAILGTLQPNERLLDVGCGTGTLAVAAAQRGVRVVGIDRSSPLLRLAREKAARAGVSIAFRNGNLPLLPVPSETFDVATATFVLSELSRDEATLTVYAMAEAVHPGGRIVIADEAVSDSCLLRFISALQRLIFAVLAFAILQQLAPTRQHPLAAIIAEAGLIIRHDSSYQDGALRLIVAERPAALPALHRATKALDAVLPQGLRRAVLRTAAWFALPIAIMPGVYCVGTPSASAPVLLTGNFLATIEALRRALVGRDCYLIVEDTNGWNVWCASDAGLFTAEKAVALMRLYDVEHLISHRRIIVPRLGGRIQRPLAALTRWNVVAGPIEARDLPDFLQSNSVTPAMRSLGRMYRIPERLRVGALTLVQMPLWLLPLRVLPITLRRPVQYFAVLASWILPVFHYQIPGRTGIVKGGVLGCGVSLALLAKGRASWTKALAVLLSAPFIGWIYQSSSPVIYWKRLWK